MVDFDEIFFMRVVIEKRGGKGGRVFSNLFGHDAPGSVLPLVF